ncbi:MAG: hypothetical protein JWM68_4267 [Verrucomicrobiales bacterium]|nr:hypothetical protein [Verrucomicrobiales bacterium]
MLKLFSFLLAASVASTALAADKTPVELRVGVAGHAFDHLGNLGEQADAAAASGVTIIYASGLGAAGYEGLPPEKTFATNRQAAAEYVRRAKTRGIQLAIGYVCATSIVKLDTFDKNWSADFRKQFQTPPTAWRQVNREGNALPSWYGGEYRPACMNNPDWRTYEKYMVRQQIETGHDGIFFDNPTVHPEGCYCEFCMKKFAEFLGDKTLPTTSAIATLRDAAVKRPKDFLRFRSTIASDFMAEMRRFARTINPKALITCNNSLNSPEVFHSQSRNYGYNIYEMSKVEDMVVVEDMGNQPRTVGGSTVEYGPTYQLLQAISHHKPLVAVTIADGDYNTAPNLMRLAMAEAAAHDASYLSWPVWPEANRTKMIATVRPQADFLRQTEKLLNETKARADVLLFLPFRRWVDTDQCAPLALATALTRANVQFEAVCEENFTSTLKSFSARRAATPVVLVESESVLNADEKNAVNLFKKNGGTVVSAEKADWLKTAQAAVQPSITVQGPATIRVVVRDQGKRTIVHLYNLNVQKISSLEDKVSAASDIRLSVSVPKSHVRSVEMLTADVDSSSGELAFSSGRASQGTLINIVVPKLSISGIIVIE